MVILWYSIYAHVNDKHADQTMDLGGVPYLFKQSNVKTTVFSWYQKQSREWILGKQIWSFHIISAQPHFSMFNQSM